MELHSLKHVFLMPHTHDDALSTVRTLNIRSDLETFGDVLGAGKRMVSGHGMDWETLSYKPLPSWTRDDVLPWNISPVTSTVPPKL
jgi:hypothetical protein